MPTLHNTKRQLMQFTYEREGNDYCWLTDTLTFTKDIIHHYERWIGRGSIKVEDKQSCVKVDKLLDYLNLNRLTLDNFPGLEDYLKENYPEVLPKQQPFLKSDENEQLTERELIQGLINIIDYCELFNSVNMYKQARLYLNPNYDKSNNY